jgi:hypothetical protein
METTMKHCGDSIENLSRDTTEILAEHGLSREYKCEVTGNGVLSFMQTTPRVNIDLQLLDLQDVPAARCMMLTYFFMQLSRLFDSNPGTKITVNDMANDIAMKQGAMKEMMMGRQRRDPSLPVGVEVYGLAEEVHNSPP